MGGTWRLLAAYACSGAAGLIYEVSWTRLLTLSMGHTTAAVSTVVAAFMGGLAAGAALGGRAAPRLTPRAALYAYATLEVAVAVLALLTGRELALLAPLLKWAYADAHAPLAFGFVRLIASLALLSVPAAALGATFPLALRWSARGSAHPGEQGGALYAANTFGAALGALSAGFVLLPNLGLFRTILVGACASSVAAALAALIARTPARETPRPVARTGGRARRAAASPIIAPRVAAVVLALTGFATFTYEISWTRVFSMIAGPSTYAFSTVVTAVIAGTALGSVLGTRLSARLRRPEMGLLLALGVGALALAWTTTLAGNEVPRMMMRSLMQTGEPFASLMTSHALTIGVLILPIAAALGAAFPLALELVGADDTGIARRVGYVYAVNTIGSVLGALTAGFVAIPRFGLERTLWMATATLCAATLVVALSLRMSRFGRAMGLALTAVAAAVLAMQSGWDRELLASGAYKYARLIPPALDAETMLKAGSLLYYREGAAATVSVKRLTGAVSLSVDGKVDASTSGDMLTQKLLAHVPLLLHPRPRDVAIIGLGSGVTLAAALTHPIGSAEIVEISPEVIEAAQYFESVNHGALRDPRTRLIVGDGRSHLLLGSRKYDVIISEPSNPWMAGVAALFTREFFAAMRDRLAPGGFVCQWAHTYDISDADLRSVVGTFASVFPDATMWLVGGGDLLLVGGDAPVADRLDEITRNWSRPGVAADLGQVGAREPFAVLSLYVGGRDVVQRYTNGAALQTDDRQALEFSGPAALYSESSDHNISAIRAAQSGAQRPGGLAESNAGTAADWRSRADMLFKASAYAEAFESYKAALARDPADAESLNGIVPAAVAARRQDEAVRTLQSLASAHPDNVLIRVALSRLFASSGAFQEAVDAATEACRVGPKTLAGWEQLASVFSDAGNAERLEATVEIMRQIDPQSAATWYYTAALEFLRGRLDGARHAAEKAIAADPRRAAAYNLLGAAHASAGSLDRARQAFTTAMEINPRDAATYVNLAVLELNSGNPLAARGWFAEALSLDPTSEAAREGLARAGMSARR